MTTEQEQLAAANQTILEQQARIEQLESALSNAADDIQDWGAYASEYFQQRWGLDADVEKYKALATPSGLSALREHEAKVLEEAADSISIYRLVDAAEEYLRHMAAERRG